MKKLIIYIFVLTSLSSLTCQSQSLRLLDKLRQEQTSDTPFVSRWETTASNETVTIPLRAASTYNITVSWGDGSSDTVFNAAGDLTSLNHEYSIAGTYDITIRVNSDDGWKGVFFNNAGDKTKIKDIMQWGNSAIDIINFYGCTALTGNTATDVPNLTSLQFMTSSFRSCTSLNITNWSSWQPYSVTSFQHCFRDMQLNAGDSSWITSNTTNINAMYLSNDLFNQDWAAANISNITDLTLFNANGDGWSTTNYSNTLIGWASQTPVSGETFDAGNVQYNSSAVAARDTLVTTYSWTINDLGLEP
jgi:hypothetical protein